LIKNCLEGQVAEISAGGDLVTDIAIASAGDLPNILEVRVRVGPHETIGIHPADHQEPESTLIAIENPNGMVEIGITGMNLGEMLGIKVGEKVTIKW